MCLLIETVPQVSEMAHGPLVLILERVGNYTNNLVHCDLRHLFCMPR